MTCLGLQNLKTELFLVLYLIPSLSCGIDDGDDNDCSNYHFLVSVYQSFYKQSSEQSSEQLYTLCGVNLILH